MTETNLYLYIAVGATTVFVVKLLLLLTVGDGGADADLEMDISDDLDGGDSFELISLQSVMAFLMIFGWTALAFKEEFGMARPSTMLGASAIGLIGSYVFSLIIYKLKKLTSDVVRDVEVPVGLEVEVYSNIPKNNEGYGKVKLEINGQLRYLEAYTNDKKEIKTGSKVKVSKTQPLTVTQGEK